MSILGRMVFGIHCLKISLLQLGYETPILTVLTDRLAEFVEKDRLDIWESRIGEVAPYALLDTHPDNDLADYETLPLGEAQALKSLYTTMPAELTDLIDSVVNIGESNLYGDMGDHSEDSLTAIQLVTEKVIELGIAIPDVSPYVRSPFTENDGWGFTRSISTFV